MDELLETIIAWGEGQEAVRAMLLTGSRGATDGGRTFGSFCNTLDTVDLLTPARSVMSRIEMPILWPAPRVVRVSRRTTVARGRRAPPRSGLE